MNKRQRGWWPSLASVRLNVRKKKKKNGWYGIGLFSFILLWCTALCIALYLLLYTLNFHTMKKPVPLSGINTSFSLSFFENELWNSARSVCHALICFNGGVDVFGFIESNQISFVTIWGRHYFHNYLWILPVWLWDLLRQLLCLNTFWFSWFNRWAVFTFIGSKWN